MAWLQRTIHLGKLLSMANITVKQMSPQLLERLRSQARKRKISLNLLVKEILAQGVGLSEGARVFNDLSDLAGSWTEEEAREFEKNTRPFREIDAELWH